MYPIYICIFLHESADEYTALFPMTVIITPRKPQSMQICMCTQIEPAVHLHYLVQNKKKTMANRMCSRQLLKAIFSDWLVDLFIIFQSVDCRNMKISRPLKGRLLKAINK